MTIIKKLTPFTVSNHSTKDRSVKRILTVGCVRLKTEGGGLITPHSKDSGVAYIPSSRHWQQKSRRKRKVVYINIKNLYNWIINNERITYIVIYWRASHKVHTIYPVHGFYIRWLLISRCAQLMKTRSFSEKKKSDFDVTKCLQQIEMPDLLHVCA